MEQANTAWKYQGLQEEIQFVVVKTDLCTSNFSTLSPTVRMSSTYSIKVNQALESYGARTHGSLARRVERLKRFTDMKNRQYAAEIRLEHARMVANQEREERVQRRIREIQEVGVPVYTPTSHSYNLRPREENGLNLLWRAIENGFVNTNRG